MIAALRLFIQQWLDAKSSGFRSEVTAEGIRASEPTTATPLSPTGKITLADKLLFACMQPFVPLAIMLPGKCFAAYCANKWSFIRMCP